MREYGCGFGPQPRRHQVFVFACWKVDETVDAAAYPRNTADLLMMRQQRVGIAGSRCLACREESFLGGGDVVKCLLGGLGSRRAGHAQNLSYI